jgi:hypothetical protein
VPARPYKVRVVTLMPSASISAPPKLTTLEVELPATGKPVTLSWSDGQWTAKQAP